MRRLIATSAALLVLLLVSQAVLAQYEPGGSLTLSPSTVLAGGQVTVSGTGFAPASPVQLTIDPDPAHLATVTTDGAGAFSAEVTIPASLSGEYTIVATGTDSVGSVLALSAVLSVTTSGVPPTSTSPSSTSRSGSDPMVLAIAGAGIVVMTGLVLLVATRRRRSLR